MYKALIVVIWINNLMSMLFFITEEFQRKSFIFKADIVVTSIFVIEFFQ